MCFIKSHSKRGTELKPDSPVLSWAQFPLLLPQPFGGHCEKCVGRNEHYSSCVVLGLSFFKCRITKVNIDNHTKVVIQQCRVENPPFKTKSSFSCAKRFMCDES